MSPRRTALNTLVITIAVSALAAIYCLLIGEWTDLELRVIATSLILAGASILVMGCGAAWETQRNRVTAGIGFVATLAATALSLTVVWHAVNDTGDVWKAIAVAWVVAIASAHASLLSLARLPRTYGFIGVVTQISIVMLAAQIIQLIILDKNPQPDWRLIGVNTVLVAALSIVIPVMHKLAAPETAPQHSGHITCPQCGATSEGPLGDQTCGGCAKRFRVTLL